MQENSILTKAKLEYKNFCEENSLASAEDFNKKIHNGKIAEIIEACENRHVRQIENIASEIQQKKRCRLVFISGPSSSGKTTFSLRLIKEMQKRGIHAFSLSLDDYYKTNDLMPFDSDGKPDWESPLSLDISKINNDLLSLLSNQETTLPVFDFGSGQKISNGKKIKLGYDDVLITEGIHALNPLINNINSDFNQYNIYCTPLNEVKGADNEPISSQLTRKLRRLIRDYYYRNADYNLTFSTWERVEKGAETNIYPLTQNADCIFNSALIYEYGVYAKHLNNVFKGLADDDPYYADAKELLETVSQFESVPDKYIPQNSIIQEFIKHN